MSVESWNPEQAMSVGMTEAAIAHTRSQLAAEQGALGIRLAAKKSGCSGFMYHVDFVTEAGDNDRQFEIAEDVRIFVDAADLPFVGGTTIDFVQDGLSRVFKFDNPRAKDTCGCGESFSI